MKRKENVSMKEYTTYKTGGNVKIMYFPESIDELIELLKTIDEKYYIIGNGSNLIVDDNDFDGAIINLKEIKNYSLDGNKLTCECGVMLPFVSNMMINESKKGLEWAISIPGTIGASIYNNAGAYNSDMSSVVESVKVLDKDFNIKEFSNEDCKFSYRDSIFKQNKEYIVLSCVINLEDCDIKSLKELVEDRKQRRLQSQPLEYPSAGSVFRNPSKEQPAGKLIEDAHLKGRKIGGAMISDKHANFIVNVENAKSSDIKELIKLIKETIKKDYDIELKLEQEILDWE